VSIKCKECGFIHPETAKGQCPVAVAQKMESTDRGRKIVSFISKLSKFLETAEDFESKINQINNLLGI